MKSKIYLFPALFLLISMSCKKIDYLIPKPQFSKLYGGSYTEHGYAITATSDGGYAFAGITDSWDGDIGGPENDYFARGGWVVKVDKNGSILWQKQIGMGGAPDHFYAIVETRDGGYIAAGGAYRNDIVPVKEVWLVKYDRNGNKAWEKTYGGSRWDEAYSIVRASGSGYIIAGITESTDRDVTGNHGRSDAWILKIDENGNKLWQKTYGGSSRDEARCIVASGDGGYIVAGITESMDGDVTINKGWTDAWVFRISENGNLLWQKTFGGTSSDEAYAVTGNLNDGYGIAAYTFSNDGDVTGNHGNNDVWLINVTNQGEMRWQKTLGGTGDDRAYSIATSLLGEYVVGGSTTSNNGDVSGKHGSSTDPFSTDAWVIALDRNGNKLWQKALGGSGYDAANAIISNAANGFAVVGLSSSNDGDVRANHGATDAWIITVEKP